MTRKRNRGISQLIASIILIAIVLVGGIFVFAVWSSVSGTERQKTQVNFEYLGLYKSVGQPKATFATTMKNTGSKPLTKIIIKLHNETAYEIPSVNPSSPLQPGHCVGVTLTPPTIHSDYYVVGNFYTVQIVRAEATDGSSFSHVTTVMCLGASQKATGLVPFLKYTGKYYIHSTVTLYTDSEALIDDTEAIQDFSLTTSQVVLAIYSACNYMSAPYEYEYGKKLGINVDGSDIATIQSSPGYGSEEANGGIVVWVGVLDAGSHTIKGRFAGIGGYSGEVDERQLTIIIFQGTSSDFRYVRSTIPVYTDYMDDDTEAIQTFNVPDDCKALIIYSTCNYHGATESQYGKDVWVEIDGEDTLTYSGSSPSGWNRADSQCFPYLTTLNAGFHTIKGRFSITQAGGVTISERQLAILLFPENLETDFIESDAYPPPTGFGDTLTNDSEAIITRVLTGTRYVFALYGTNRMPFGVASDYGEKASINIDGVDYGLNAQSPFDHDRRNSVALQSDVVEVEAGSHTVKGRFASNDSGSYWELSHRQLAVLWFIDP